MGYAETEYYLENETPFFVLQWECHYNRPFYYDSKTAKEKGDSEAFDPQKSSYEENRFYFCQNHLIQWINPSHKKVHLSATTSLIKEKEILTGVEMLKVKLSE